MEATTMLIKIEVRVTIACLTEVGVEATIMVGLSEIGVRTTIDMQQTNNGGDHVCGCHRSKSVSG